MDSEAKSGLQADHVIDATGLQCVQLLLRFRTESIDLPAGALVELISTDPVSVLDLPAWCHLTGHAHLGSHQINGTYVHLIRLSGKAELTRSDAPWHS